MFGKLKQKISYILTLSLVLNSTYFVNATSEELERESLNQTEQTDNIETPSSLMSLRSIPEGLTDLEVNSSLTLTEDTSCLDLYIDNCELDLNGYTLTVYGSVYQTSGQLTVGDGEIFVANDYDHAGGNIVVNEGACYISGNYTSSGSVSAAITVSDESGVFEVSGNVENSSGTLVLNGTGDISFNSDVNILSCIVLQSGNLNIAGNVNALSGTTFGCNNDTSVTLNGNSMQSFTTLGGGAISKLIVNNTSGVNITSSVNISHLDVINNSNIGNLSYNTYGSLILDNDILITGDCVLSGGVIDLSTNNLTVEGNVLQYGGRFLVNGNSLSIEGDYTVNTSSSSYPFSFNSGTGYLCVNGDLSSNYDLNYSYGKLEVKGDFTVPNIYAASNASLILSGTLGQSFNITNLNYSMLSNLEIINSSNAGVEFLSAVPFPQKVLVDSNVTGLNFVINYNGVNGDSEIDADYIISGTNTLSISAVTINNKRNVTIQSGSLSFNDSTFIVNGDLTLQSGNVYLNSGKLVVNGNIDQTGGNIYIGNGYLVSHGNYTLGANANIYMGENSYAYVAGNFISNMTADQSENLIGGVLEVKGNFTSTTSGFNATEDHKTILSGTGVQSVSFINNGTSKFNILEITKSLETGYSFNTTPLWNTLIYNEDYSVPTPSVPTGLTVDDYTHTYIDLSWDSQNVLGYKLYRNGIEYKTLYRNSFTDTELEINTTYVYKLKAFDIYGNLSDFSDEVSVYTDVDTIAPEVLSVTPSINTTLTANPTISFALSDNRKLASATLSRLVNGVYSNISTMALTSNSEVAAFTWNTTNIPSGEYAFRLTVTDTTGNVTTEDYTYQLSNHIPTAPVLTGTAGVNRVVLNWTSTDENIVKYRVLKKESGYFTYLSETAAKTYTDLSAVANKNETRSYTYAVRGYTAEGNTVLSNEITVVPIYEDETAPVIASLFDKTTVLGNSVSMTMNATDNSGDTISYRWSVNGTEYSGQTFSHTFTESGDYVIIGTATDTSGNSSSTSAKVSVLSSDKVGSLSVIVKDEENNIIPNAYVYIDTPDGGVNFISDSNGVVSVEIIAGSYNVSAYKENYLPNEDNFTVQTGQTTNATITLKEGNIVTQSTVVSRLSKSEIEAKGIDSTDPDNQYVYDYTTTLTFEGVPVTINTVVNGIGTIHSSTNANTEDIYAVSKAIAIEGHPEVAPPLAVLVVPMQVKWLKEFFNVQMYIHNEADSQFTLKNSTVELQLPTGLSLAKTAAPQNLTVNLGDIAGQNTTLSEWIVRGDIAGQYNLSADFNATLMPFTAPVASTLTASNAITVQAENALVLSAEMCDTAVVGSDYYINYTLTNRGVATINDIELAIGDGTGSIFTFEGENQYSPTVEDGDVLTISELSTGESIHFIYKTTFNANADPDTLYNLIGADINGGDEVISIVPILSNKEKETRLVNTLFSDSETIGGINGQKNIEIKAIYTNNENTETPFGNMTWDYGWTFKNIDGIFTLTTPEGIDHKFAPNLDPEQSTSSVNDMLINGFTPISNEATQYSITKTQEGYLVTSNQLDKYGFDENGALTSIEDKTGYKIDISRTAANITIEEVTTGKTAVATLNAAGNITNLSSDLGSYAITYDADENISRITDPLGNITAYDYITGVISEKSKISAQSQSTTIFKPEFDENGRPTKLTDGKNNSITFTYDDSVYWHTTVDIVDREGNTASKTLNRFGWIVKEVDGNENEVRYTYNGTGKLASVIKSIQNVVAYTYDGKDNLLTVTDQNDNVTRFEYDNNSNRTKQTLPNGAVTNYSYNAQNRISSTTDEKGTVTAYTYDNDGNVTQITITPTTGTPISASYSYANSKCTSATDFNGNTTTISYNADGTVNTVTDALNNTTAYTYNSNKQPTEISYSNGFTESYSYDEKGNVKSYTDKNGNTTNNTYDENYNLSTSSIGNATFTYSYDKNDRLTSIVDNKGTVRYNYDEAGNLTAETDKNGNNTVYGYDEFNRLISVTKGGGTTEYTLDLVGNVVGVTDALNYTTVYEYDEIGNVISATNALGNTTEFTVNQSGEITKITTPLEREYSFTYDFRGNKLTETDFNGNQTSYTYDPNGNLSSVTNALNQTTSFTYDALNRKESQKDAKNHTTYFAYNDTASTYTITLPTGRVCTYEFDGNGNVTAKNEGNGRVETTYNYNNKPTEIEDALGNTTEYTYDSIGNILSKTTPEQHTYNYITDGNGNITQETDPLSGVVKHNYNAFNLQTKLTDANNNETEYVYNALQQLTSEKFATNEDDSYVYNAIGELTSYTNKRGQQISYAYNEDGLKTSRTTPEGITAYTYDDNGNLLTVTKGNNTITRTYDALNRVTSYKNAQNQTIQYSYDNVGNLETLTYPDGKTVTYTYNENNQLATVMDWNNRVTTYTYNSNGKLQTTTRPDGSIETNYYNEIGQLTQVTDIAQDNTVINEYTYTYDADGNIITENNVTQPSTNDISIPNSQMSYSTANQLTNYNGNIITYDADGNAFQTPLNGTMYNLTYDSLNQLTDVVTTGSAIHYTYDAEGYRIAKTEGGNTTTYVVDTNNELSQVLTSTTNGKTTYYVYGLGLIAQDNTADGYKLYHYDYRGSTTTITNLNGEITDTVFYSPYGKILKRTGTTTTPYLFVGKYGVETDSCNLYYMRARYYNPYICRFINIDPIRDRFNWYCYVRNSINSIDPIGLEEIYIFYNKGDENNKSLKDRAVKKEKELKNLGKTVYIKEIASDIEFSTEWDKMENNGKKIEEVYLFIHSNPHALILAEGAIVTEARQDKNYFQLRNLSKKNIGSIIMNSCNSAHLDHANSNLAFEFTKYQNVDKVFGWDGSMKWNILTDEPMLNFDFLYYFFHDTAKDNYSESNPNLYFDSALKEGTSRAPKGLIEYRRQNNTIFVFPANGDMYNYIDIYDLCGRSISDDYEKASEPTA